MVTAVKVQVTVLFSKRLRKPSRFTRRPYLFKIFNRKTKVIIIIIIIIQGLRRPQYGRPDVI